MQGVAFGAVENSLEQVEDAERLPSLCCAVEDLMKQDAADETAEAKAEDNTRPSRIENHCRSSHPQLQNHRSDEREPQPS